MNHERTMELDPSCHLSQNFPTSAQNTLVYMSRLQASYDIDCPQAVKQDVGDWVSGAGCYELLYQIISCVINMIIYKCHEMLKDGGKNKTTHTQNNHNTHTKQTTTKINKTSSENPKS